MSSNDWLEYKKLFEKAIDRLDSIDKDIVELKLEIAQAKAKNAIFFGFLGGILPFVAEFLIKAASSAKAP